MPNATYGDVKGCKTKGMKCTTSYSTYSIVVSLVR